MTPFIKRRFKTEESMDGKNIKTALYAAMRGKRKTDIQDVARLICLHLCLTLFFATTGNTIKWGFIAYVENLDEIREYAWAARIVEVLMTSIDRSNMDPTKVSGCTLALQYWMCEHSRIIEPEIHNVFPRFIKWNLISLNTKLRSTDINAIDPSEVHGGELALTQNEAGLYGEDFVKPTNEDEQCTDPVFMECEDSLTNSKSDDPRTTDGEGDTSSSDNKDQGVKPTTEDEKSTVPVFMKREASLTNSKSSDASATDGEGDTSSSHSKDQDMAISSDCSGRASHQQVDIQDIVVYGSDGESKGKDDTEYSTPSHEYQQSPIDLNTDTQECKRGRLYDCEVHETPLSINQTIGDSPTDQRGDVARIQELEADIRELRESLTAAQETVKELRLNGNHQKTHQHEHTGNDADGTDQIVHQLREQVEGLKAQHVADEALANNLRRYYHILERDMQEKDSHIKYLELALEMKGDELRDIVDDAHAHQVTQDVRIVDRVKELEGLLNEREVKIEELQRRVDELCRTKIEEPDSDQNEVKLDELDAANAGNDQTDTDRDMLGERSLVRHIKTKTRKRKVMTDYVLHEPKRVCTSAVEADDKGKAEDDNTVVCVDDYKDPDLKVPARARVFQLLTKADQEVLHLMDTYHGPNFTVYKRRGSKDVITLADIIAVIQEKEIGNNIIDAFAGVLMEMQRNGDIVQNTDLTSGISYVHNSLCMKFVRENDVAALKKFVDDPLSENLNQFRYYHFPLISHAITAGGRHWTLAVFDTVVGIWRFYNSLWPRTRNRKDPNAGDLELMRAYVDRRINSAISDDAIVGTQDKETRVEEVRTSPQQVSPSYDCGVIVCHVMETVFLNEPLGRKCDANQMRAQIIHRFLHSAGTTRVKKGDKRSNRG